MIISLKNLRNLEFFEFRMIFLNVWNPLIIFIPSFFKNLRKVCSIERHPISISQIIFVPSHFNSLKTTNIGYTKAIQFEIIIEISLINVAYVIDNSGKAKRLKFIIMLSNKCKFCIVQWLNCFIFLNHWVICDLYKLILN